MQRKVEDDFCLRMAVVQREGEVKALKGFEGGASRPWPIIRRVFYLRVSGLGSLPVGSSVVEAK